MSDSTEGLNGEPAGRPTDRPLEAPATERTPRRAWPAVTLVVVACWILTAHFLRSFDVVFMLFFLFLPLLLSVRSAWAVRVVQVALAFGVLEWVAATARFLAERRATGEPAGRLLIIMGAVIAFTLLAALALESAGPRTRYGLRTARFFSAGPPPPVK
ncbi:MAG: hypothetical protein ACYC33_05680 [Thermoleophilia bacterium]